MELGRLGRRDRGRLGRGDLMARLSGTLPRNQVGNRAVAGRTLQGEDVTCSEWGPFRRTRDPVERCAGRRPGGARTFGGNRRLRQRRDLRSRCL